MQVLKVMAKKLVRKCLEMLRKLATVEIDSDEEVRVDQTIFYEEKKVQHQPPTPKAN